MPISPPLTCKPARGRSIIVVENAYLHLVWYYDRIFIKQMPPYLLSSAFWEYSARSDLEMWQAAAGFMGAYAYLIKYEIDFRKPQSTELRLIPTDDGDEKTTNKSFAQFIAPFAELNDDRVRPRYHSGEMRLTRLNWYARFLLGRLTYHHIHAQWNEVLGRILAPFLTVFILLSTMLTAMQVELAAQRGSPGSGSWDLSSQVSHWVSLAVIIFIAVVFVLLIFFLLFMFIHDQLFARKVLRRKRSTHRQLEMTIKSGVV